MAIRARNVFLIDLLVLTCWKIAPEQHAVTFAVNNVFGMVLGYKPVVAAYFI